MGRITKREENKSSRIKPTTSETGSPQVEHPVFCFRYIQNSHCLSSCDKKEKAAFVSQLHLLSKLEWKDIHPAPKHGHGTEKISQSSIKKAMPQQVSPDTQLYALRFQGKKAFVGYKTRNIFHILWIDRSFNLYSH